MATEQKRAGNRGKGRPKGSVNKVTALLKDQILEAGAKAHPDGMVGYLAQQAQENPSAFLALLGKVLPTQVNHGGADGGALPTTIILSAPAHDSRED